MRRDEDPGVWVVGGRKGRGRGSWRRASCCRQRSLLFSFALIVLRSSERIAPSLSLALHFPILPEQFLHTPPVFPKLATLRKKAPSRPPDRLCELRQSANEAAAGSSPNLLPPLPLTVSRHVLSFFFLFLFRIFRAALISAAVSMMTLVGLSALVTRASV